MIFVESETVELKSEVVQDICKEIIAFANTKGGVLYIGVADDGTVVGVDNADQVTLQLNNKIWDSVKPDVTMFVHYETQIADGRTILAVIVQRGTDRPYYLAGKGLKSGGVFVRNGSSSDPATDTAIRKMIKDTDGDSFETRRSLEQTLTFDDAREQFAKQNVPFDAVKMQTLGLLTGEGIYTNIAMLLSDECSSTIKAAVFSGMDKSSFQDRREFTGSLFRQMNDLYAYLDIHNQTKATFEGLYRSDVRDYPEETLREALLNAVVHRDYSFSASTLVSIYADRIEFVSVGGLPAGIELEDILLGLSVCRNPGLAAVFYRLKLIEAYGTGLPKILTAYDGCAVKPEIEVTNNAFKITLPNRNTVNESVMIHDSGRVYGSCEDRVLAYIESRGSAVRREIEELLGVSPATAGRILKQMSDDGLICQQGKGKAIRYYIKK